jgi:hypothetical protein
VIELEGTSNPEDGLDYVVEDPIASRADLTALGIEEVDKGVCEDSFENRAILRRSRLIYEPVYNSTGRPSGLIKVRSAESTRERRIASLAEKRPILVNSSDNNSDYLTGLDLLAEEATDYLVPPWVMGATRKYLKEQEAGGPPTPKRQPSPQPHRCRHIKEDGIRCMLWGSGRPVDDGLCRIHLRSLKHKSSDDIERAREKLMQAAPYAVDKLEELMEYAESEPVKLKAATEILDRAGVRGGIEIDSNVSIDLRPAADVINERLERLAKGAIQAAAMLSQNGAEIVDAEVVVEDTGKTDGSETSNEPQKEPPVEKIHNGVDDSGDRPALPKEENITNE